MTAEPKAEPRVAYVITRPERGGAQSHVLELLRGLSSPAGALLVTGSDRDRFLLEEAARLGVNTRETAALVHPITPQQDLLAFLALRREFLEFRPDLIHAHSSKAGLLARLAARSLGIPSVFTAHGWAFTEGASRGRRTLATLLERLGAWAGDQVIAVSDYDRDLGLRLGVGTAVSVTRIHNALSEAGPVRRAAWTGEGKLRVAMVARFAPPKQQAALIRAAAKVPQVQLLLLGDGPELLAAQDLARTLGSDVVFLGSRPDVPEILAGCHVFALVSLFEGFPVSTLEAMRAGLALVVSDVGGAAEVFPVPVPFGGQDAPGVQVPKGDEGALSEALMALVLNPARTGRMGDTARQLFLRKFTVPEMLSQTRAVYARALNRHAG